MTNSLNCRRHYQVDFPEIDFPYLIHISQTFVPGSLRVTLGLDKYWAWVTKGTDRCLNQWWSSSIMHNGFGSLMEITCHAEKTPGTRLALNPHVHHYPDNTNHGQIMKPGHYTNCLWALIWNIMKNLFVLILILIILLGHNFAHVTTAELSWHVQIYVLVWLPFLK